LNWGICLLYSVDGTHTGRRILLDIVVLGSVDPTDLTHIATRALLDTGATKSAITLRIVTQLQLALVGKRPIMVATEQRLLDFFMFRLGLFPTDQPANIPFIFAETEGFQISQTHDFEVLLGMDVLSQCDFSMARSGNWNLTFG
jgi:hypothetical protein